MFALSYLARPFGSISLAGCQTVPISKAARISMMMMAIPPIIIVLIPSYASIGIAAPIALVAARLVQGFAAGGELPVTATLPITILRQNLNVLLVPWLIAVL